MSYLVAKCGLVRVQGAISIAPLNLQGLNLGFLIKVRFYG